MTNNNKKKHGLNCAKNEQKPLADQIKILEGFGHILDDFNFDKNKVISIWVGLPKVGWEQNILNFVLISAKNFSKVNTAFKANLKTESNLKMQAILMAHWIPSRHNWVMVGSSLSWSPTLNAANAGDQTILNIGLETK